MKEPAVEPRRHIALLLPSLKGGGVARSFVQLANGFVERGHKVEILLCQAAGFYLASLSREVEIVQLRPEFALRARLRALSLSPDARRELILPILLTASAPPVLPYIASLARYLETARPDVLLAGKTHTNLLAIWGERQAANSTRVAISERTSLSSQIEMSSKWRWRFSAPLVRRLYRSADAITSVSDGVSDDLASITGIARESIETIYNPIARPKIYEQAKVRPDHPFFDADGPPVILAAGRFADQKQFPILLQAFARLRKRIDARLVILGEGKGRGMLRQRISALGLESSVSLPGFSDNPYSYMTNASVFVLSSAWEGLPGVLIEALVCGCPIVSTDCSSGPNEILAGGKYGKLVPVGDVEAMALAIQNVLERPPDREPLRNRGAEFSLEKAVDGYLRVLFPNRAG